METSSPLHTEEATTANSPKPENELKTVDTIYTWGGREDLTEKDKKKVAEL